MQTNNKSFGFTVISLSGNSAEPFVYIVSSNHLSSSLMYVHQHLNLREEKTGLWENVG